MSRRKYTDEQLTAAVQTSFTMAEVITKLGLFKTGSAYIYLKHHIARLGLSLDHFLGQSWARGKSLPSKRLLPLEQVLVKGRRCNSDDLKKRLIADGQMRMLRHVACLEHTPTSIPS